MEVCVCVDLKEGGKGLNESAIKAIIMYNVKVPRLKLVNLI